MFSVVTLEREFGAGGSAIARTAASMLGWNLMDRSLITAAARTAHMDAKAIERYDERVEPWWRRFHRGGLLAAAVTAGVSVTDAEFIDPGPAVTLTRRAIARAAAAGKCVIVGRGAQCLLQDREDVFQVFIYGPWQERVSRVRNRIKPPRDIEELIRLTDCERADYIETHYGCDWKNPHLYQLMISSQIGVEHAAEMIVDAVERGCVTRWSASSHPLPSARP